MSERHLPPLTRRAALLGLSGAVLLGGARMAVASGPAGEARLVVVLLRGALDGLAAVQPYGDPDLAGLRGALALPEPERPGENIGGVLDLGGFFGLHPALPQLHAMFGKGEALAIHAAAGPWRSRSHFEAQDFLESGGAQRLSSGWLNRALAAMGPEAAGSARRGLAVGVEQPLLLRGPAPVGAYAAGGRTRAEPDTLALLARWHAADAKLGVPFAEGLRARGFTAAVLAGEAAPPPGGGFPALAAAAGRLLADPRGPRVAALELGGWDTHAAQAGRLPAALRQLDAGLAALRDALGAEAWRRTAVLCVTEFGRTARANGTGGTDHGTAACAFLAGGAVAGGRVVADWPGLAPGRLPENRDLAPTLDLRRVAKALLAGHLGLGAAALEAAFPASADASPLRGLLRAG